MYIRVKQALMWLKRNKGVLQKDIADRMGMAEASFTRGIARIKEKNDEDFVIKFHSAVNEYISLDYLLTGNGKMMLAENKKDVTQDSRNVAQDFNIDISSVFNAALAAKDDAIESLKRELHTKDELIRSLREQLTAKDQLIAEQKARLIDYRHTIDSHTDLSDYPFPIGAADKPRQKSIRK